MEITDWDEGPLTRCDDQERILRRLRHRKTSFAVFSIEKMGGFSERHMDCLSGVLILFRFFCEFFLKPVDGVIA